MSKNKINDIQVFVECSNRKVYFGFLRRFCGHSTIIGQTGPKINSSSIGKTKKAWSASVFFIQNQA